MKLKIFYLLLMLLLSQPSFSQFIIKGKVTDQASGTAIAGATIRLSAQSQTGSASRALTGTTNQAGLFELNANQKAVEIKVTYLGYQPRTIKLASTDEFIEITLTANQGQELDAVQITSRYYKKYSLNTVSSALRLQSPLINVSQNIQEIGHEIIADQSILNMNDGISRNVSGVIRQEVANNLGPYLFMRGGMVSSLRNGIDLTPIYRGPLAEDAAIIDRVEFIKGPSGFMNNIGDPAGTFNVMTKQPTGINHYSANVMLGSWNLYRASADLDGTLTKDKKLQYRLNVMGMSTKSFVQTDFSKQLLVAPVLKYLISDKSWVSAEYIYQKLSYGQISPIVMTPNGFGSLPEDFTINEKSLDPYAVSDHTGIVTFNHKFNTNWSLTARGAFMRNQKEGIYLWVTGVNPANPNILLRNPKYDLDRATVFSQQAFINGKVKTGAVNHQLLAGVDLNQKKFIADAYVSYDTYKDANGATQLTYYPLDVTNPVRGAAIPDYATPGGIHNGNTNQQIKYYSVYAIDELGFFEDKLRLTLGARFTSVLTDNIVSKVITGSSDKKLTPRIGLSYSLTPDLSFYALYDRTIVPQTGTTSSGEAIKPLTGVNHEIGIKKNWFNSKWNTTLAFYQINRANIVSGDPDNALYRVQVGETSSKGIDVDLMGELVKGLNVVVNYAYNDAKVDRDANPLLIGARTPVYVKHVQNTWLNYELPGQLLKGFSVSLGYQYQAGRGDRYVNANPKTAPDYFRLDGGIAYKKEHFRINLMVNNLLDKHLIATPWYRGGLYYWVPQAPVNGRLSMSYSF